MTLRRKGGNIIKLLQKNGESLRYLFFDIEASEGRSMCSFGYVLTDENFCILKKEDILINPEAQFCTQARSKKKREEGKGIRLAYPEKVFRKSPVFSKVYDKIKEILEKDGQTIIGFSHSNDVRYLCTACKRYKMPYFTYKFFDIQDVYREYSGITDQISLEKIINELGVDIGNYTLHKSDDDAEISMLVAKALCEKTSVTLSGLIEKYSRYKGETSGGEIKYNGIDSERAAVKKARNLCSGVVLTFANNRKVGYVKGSPLNGKKICSGTALGKDDWIFALKLISCLAEKGARYIGNVRDADFYVRFYDNEGEKGDRLYYINKNLQGSKIKIIPKDELYKLMGMSEKEISEFTSPKIDKLVAQTERNVGKILKAVSERNRHGG